MNLRSGVFTALKAGIYTFSFSIMKHYYTLLYTDIAMRVLKLKKEADRIDLWKSSGEVFTDYAPDIVITLPARC